MHIDDLNENDLWAKRDPRDIPTSWHPLVDHCIDVGCVAEAILQLPTWQKRLGSLGIHCETKGHRDLLGLIAGLHDIGKVSDGFQIARGPGSRPEGHSAPGWALLSDEPTGDTMRVACALVDVVAGSDRLGKLLHAAVCHHGRIVPRSQHGSKSVWKQRSGRDPAKHVTQLATELSRGFPEAVSTALQWQRSELDADNSACQAFAGLIMLADWLGSDLRFFPYRTNRQQNRWAFARSAAAQAIRVVGLDVEQYRSLPTPKFRHISEFPNPHGVQSAIEDCAIPTKPSIVTIEASTGSGKTEAALLWFARLFAAGEVDGLYFAVPRRLAAKELYTRVVNAMQRLWPNGHPPVVLAVPGFIEADAVSAQALPDFKVQWDDPGFQGGRGWAAERPKRFLTAPIAIGTVDQVLQSSLATKHSQLRGVSLLRNLLIVDEVHASDAYMMGVLERVLKRQQQSGGHSLLMSATLGVVARKLLHAPNRTGTQRRKWEAIPYEVTKNTPYPAVWLDQQETPAVVRDDSTQKHVGIMCVQSADIANDIAQKAAQAAASGARVLVIRNLVADCIATHQALEEVVIDPAHMLQVNGVAAPHHSRFAPKDRILLDEALVDRLGRCPSQRRPVVVVATSTAEQSLDLDADLLITDLCPMDVLLQRIGRLHRHSVEQGARPEEFREPRCLVFLPDGGFESSLGKPDRDKRVIGPHGYGTVYDDVRALALTVQAIQARPTWTLPADNRNLVESALNNERLRAVANASPQLSPVTTYIQSLRMCKKQEAMTNVQDWETWTPTSSQRLPTRLGMSDVSINVASGVPSPFEAPERRCSFVVRDSWCDLEKVAQLTKPVEATWAAAVGIDAPELRETLVYDRFGLRTDAE
jgi:CRISPR-associated endonuclease/helicase Cas3